MDVEVLDTLAWRFWGQREEAMKIQDRKQETSYSNEATPPEATSNLPGSIRPSVGLDQGPAQHALRGPHFPLYSTNGLSPYLIQIAPCQKSTVGSYQKRTFFFVGGGAEMRGGGQISSLFIIKMDYYYYIKGVQKPLIFSATSGKWRKASQNKKKPLKWRNPGTAA